MNKQESQNLMIGSWVLAGGEPRQVSSLTTKKAGFKRGTSGHRDFFRFDQLQGIPLSEELLKECVSVNPSETLVPEYMTVEFTHNIAVIKERGENVDFLIFPNLHTMQAYFLSRYGCTVVFNMEKYKENVKKEIKDFDTWMKDMGKASEQVVAALKGVSDVFKEIKSTPCHSERSEESRKH